MRQAVLPKQDLEVFMQHKLIHGNIVATAIFGATMATIGAQAWADGNTTAEPMELRRIMRELGKNMQVVIDAISRED